MEDRSAQPTCLGLLVAGVGFRDLDVDLETRRVLLLLPEAMESVPAGDRSRDGLRCRVVDLLWPRACWKVCLSHVPGMDLLFLKVDLEPESAFLSLEVGTEAVSSFVLWIQVGPRGPLFQTALRRLSLLQHERYPEAFRAALGSCQVGASTDDAVGLTGMASLGIPRFLHSSTKLTTFLSLVTVKATGPFFFPALCVPRTEPTCASQKRGVVQTIVSPGEQGRRYVFREERTQKEDQAVPQPRQT
ncbi:hypothetical protein HPB48_009983 [Haemaphysalis longicornis]|uniref:Uncharacterized protein n=1 Tax=Haemaphysalis longicornis TaxID=44386 RepID=A0A9J6FZV0_HAELO|nr:hypothetical protein HPB48_009983 [Haemaphysalis longicornis]